MEIGTGSGAIATTIAVNKPEWKITATDISQDALVVARKNIDNHGCEDRIHLLHGDLFEPIKTLKQKSFDWIVANPPYVNSGTINELSAEILEHEPNIALFAGKDGLTIIRNLIAETPHYLLPEGKLIFEIGDTQADQVAALIQEQSAYKKFQFIKDYAGIKRVVLATVN